VLLVVVCGFCVFLVLVDHFASFGGGGGSWMGHTLLLHLVFVDGFCFYYFSSCGCDMMRTKTNKRH
jgi:hypothetical protein